MAAGATLDTAGFNQTVTALANSGTVSLLGAAPGSQLTVTGAYVGNNGVLKLGTALGDSTSVSDRLILSGASANASGSTSVQITNLGGLGAQTTGNGIEVISAQGGSTTTATAFALAGGHTDAGAFEYRLYAGGAGDNSRYLRTDAALPPPAPPPPAPPTVVVAYHAEVPLFAALPAQLRQGNLAMLGNLHQRIGDDDVRAPASGANANAALDGIGNRRAWARILSTDLRIDQSAPVTPQSSGRLTGFQVGTDLWAARDWRAGVYVGQLDGSMTVSGFASGLWGAVGGSDLRSQYLGGYATYTTASGFYADGVLQAGRHRTTVQPALNFFSSASRGSSLLASIEVGQSFALGASGWRIEPQLQLVHQSLSLDDAFIGAAQVQQRTSNGWLARTGVRVKGEFATGLGTVQPYGRLNVYHAISGDDVARFIGPAGFADITSRIGSTSTEAAGGFTLAVSPRSSVYGEVGKLWASGGASRVSSSVQGSVGVRSGGERGRSTGRNM